MIHFQFTPPSRTHKEKRNWNFKMDETLCIHPAVHTVLLDWKLDSCLTPDYDTSAEVAVVRIEAGKADA